MSGINYALLGYVWMKGKYDPGSGLYLHPQTITMMLIWFVLCFTPIIKNVANTVHAVGLAMGVMWGLISSLRSTRKL
jgi:GlpG protein